MEESICMQILETGNLRLPTLQGESKRILPGLELNFQEMCYFDIHHITRT